MYCPAVRDTTENNPATGGRKSTAATNINPSTNAPRLYILFLESNVNILFSPLQLYPW